MKPGHIPIDVHHGSTSESWLVVYPDGRVKYHIENDDWAAVNRGLEAMDKWLTPDEVRDLGRCRTSDCTDARPFTERVAEAVKKLNEEPPT